MMTSITQRAIAYALATTFSVLVFFATSSVLYAADTTLGTPKAEKIAPTSQATTYNPSTVVFTLTFTLDAFGNDGYMPTTLTRGSGEGTASVFYGIETKKALIESGYANAILFSPDAEKRDGMYFLPQGEKRTFVLIAAFNDTVKDEREQRLRVTHLPLLLGNARRPITLNPSELQDFKTDFIWIEK